MTHVIRKQRVVSMRSARSITRRAFRLGAAVLLTSCLSAALAADANGDQLLPDAVKQGNHAAVERLLRDHADVNEVQSDGSTALVLAADRGELEIVRLLIAAGADVNAQNAFGATPLAAACASGHGAIVRILLEARADPNRTLLLGESPLMTAVDMADVGAVRALLEHGANTELRESKSGQTALMWAAAESHSEIVRLLIEHGADVRARSNNGFTPLLFAAQQGDVLSGRILLEAGADANEANQKDGLSPLMVATASGHTELSLLLLEKGANPNKTNSEGRTALHHAAGCAPTAFGMRGCNTEVPDEKRAELVRALLTRGADPNARIASRNRAREDHSGGVSLDGATPLHMAAAVGNVEVARALIAARADPFTLTDGKISPLHLAAGVGPPLARDWTEQEMSGLFEITKLLVERGADVNTVGEHGWTPLHGAAYKGMDRVVQLLVDHGARVDAVDGYGQTPLSIASAVITTGVKDYYGQTPRIVRSSTRALLLKLGATPLAESGVQVFGLFEEKR